MALNLHKLFVDVFHPEPGERVLVMTDVPHGKLEDHDAWRERRDMAVEWCEAWVELGKKIGLEVLPLVTFPAVGVNNGNLPLDKGDPMVLRDALGQTTLALALTQYSPTAPIAAWAKAHPDFRAATLPRVARRMEKTALSADYAEVARRCQILKDALDVAELGRVVFSTGHVWTVDLRFRTVKMDNGQLPRNREGVSVINLPSGESFQVPYEGERDGEPSRTAGEIPVKYGDELVIFRVEQNRIVEVVGSGVKATELRVYFADDPMRGNVAEFAMGCNPNAVVWGNVLEDEKAGFHWAYGRSEHLGGVIGPECFKSEAHIVHQDIVYAKDSPIQVASLMLISEAGAERELIRNGEYIF